MQSMRLILGCDKTRDLEKLMKIAEGAKLGVSAGYYPLGFTSTETGDVTWALQIPADDLAPADKQGAPGRACRPDVYRRMSSAHSISIALRAIVWTRTA